jgi:hypothetical protein
VQKAQGCGYLKSSQTTVGGFPVYFVNLGLELLHQSNNLIIGYQPTVNPDALIIEMHMRGSEKPGAIASGGEGRGYHGSYTALALATGNVNRPGFQVRITQTAKQFLDTPQVIGSPGTRSRLPFIVDKAVDKV